MKLISEDIDNKTYLIHLTKYEMDTIFLQAMYYKCNNKNILSDAHKKFLRELTSLCTTVCAHIYSNNRRGDEWWD